MPRRQKLLTQDVLKALPALYANEGKPLDEQMVKAKFYNPYGIGTWYITEYSPEDKLAYGLCVLQEAELGYVSMEELESLPAYMFGRWNHAVQGIERDKFWTPVSLAQVMENPHRY